MSRCSKTFAWYCTYIHKCIRCHQKVFIPLDLFHILLGYSLTLKLIKLYFSLINLHTIPHNDKAKTVFSKSFEMYYK